MSESDCLFCQIVRGDVDAEIIYEDDRVVAFRDINPQAPTHALVVPRKHVATINDLTDDDVDDIGALVLAAKAIAARDGIDESGYRLAMNCNRGAGQSVFHVHLHVLGGRAMDWPPG